MKDVIYILVEEEIGADNVYDSQDKAIIKKTIKKLCTK